MHVALEAAEEHLVDFAGPVGEEAELMKTRTSKGQDCGPRLQPDSEPGEQ